MNEAKLVMTETTHIAPGKTFFEGFCQDASKLPTAGIAEGSNVIEVPSGDWYFYDETAGWSVMRNIKEA